MKRTLSLILSLLMVLSLFSGLTVVAAESDLAFDLPDPDALAGLVQDTAVKYLANIPDANGVNLLYAGV